MSPLTDLDAYLLAEGTHTRLYETLGAHLKPDGGARFAVWAPNAREVSVIGDFNDWNPDAHPLRHDRCGVWAGIVDVAKRGDRYKYHIRSNWGGYRVDKADPFGVRHEEPPATASILWDLEYEWHDHEWMAERHRHNDPAAPQAVYEVHLGSWRRVPEQGGRSLTYRELAEQLPDYLVEMGYTHVEFMPVMEHPFYGSWGYQTTGYFAPTARQGTPQDFMYLIDRLHQAGIAVWLDWVPSHFPGDAHGLAYFDGTHLYEHADPRQGFHPEWQSYIFNLGRHEVRSFLLSSAMFWLHRYHADGLRVDAVASMLYLDYARPHGEWIPNPHGGRENLEAVDFLRRLNTAVCEFDAGVQMVAEESTAWPGVTHPAREQGLGFGMKWNMGWMHDTLEYMGRDPVHRAYHHDQLTFSMVYAFHERFILPLSHDEVVYGKGSLLNKMPGDDWQKRANLRLLLGYMWGHPGKKLLFMGGEIGQWREWNHDSSIDWHLLEDPGHAGIQRWVKALNHFYRETPALYGADFDPAGFRWVIGDDRQNSVLAFLRLGPAPAPEVLVVCNFTPVPRHNYGIGVPHGGRWREALNSDAVEFGGSGVVHAGSHYTAPLPAHGFYHSLYLTLPPLAAMFLVREQEEA
ncbi:MAG TPA: 1,4-alpha-glucan branching protein GlgB [Pseudomonadales bacterium]